MRKAYKEGGDLPTLRIIDEGLRIAIECSPHRDYDQSPMPNERCITHDISRRPSTTLLELKERGQVPLPLWFYEVMHEYDGLIAI